MCDSFSSSVHMCMRRIFNLSIIRFRGFICISIYIVYTHEYAEIDFKSCEN